MSSWRVAPPLNCAPFATTDYREVIGQCDATLLALGLNDAIK